MQPVLHKFQFNFYDSANSEIIVVIEPRLIFSVDMYSNEHILSGDSYFCKILILLQPTTLIIAPSPPLSSINRPHRAMDHR